MPTYASASDVVVYFPSIGTFDGTTTPTDTQVDTFVTNREAELHSVLRALGYSTPLTNSTDTALAELRITQIAAFDVWVSAYEWELIPEHIKAFRTDWRQFLADLKAGSIELATDTPDGPDDPAFGIVRSPTRDRVFTDRRSLTDWDE